MTRHSADPAVERENAANTSQPGAGTPVNLRVVFRWSVRVAVLVAAVAALVGGSRFSAFVPAASPLTSIASLLSTWTIPAAAWIGLAVGLVVLFRRRWFCRWACPTGTCADTLSRLGLKARRRCPRLPPVGQWIALATIGGALLTYPALLWLDPLALLSNAASLARHRETAAVWWGALGMVVVLIASLLWPGLWCLRLCPLGGLQDILGSLRLWRSRNPKASPVPADESTRDGIRLPRRVVLGLLAGLGFSAFTQTARARAPRPLRPPGALDEERFVGMCIRCGNCLRACPADIIRCDMGSHGVASLLTPILDFTTDYCREDCTLCTEVCPSGALARLIAEQKVEAAIGLPKVDMNICLLGDDRDCSVCRTWCPYEAIRYVFCEDPDVYTLVPQIDGERCNGCGACQAKCPTDPTPAIVIEPLEDLA